MTTGEYRKVGTISKPHGIRGAFVLFLESDFPEWLARQKRLFAEIDGVMVPWTVQSCTVGPSGLLVKVAEVNDRNLIEKYRQTGLYVTEAEARSAADREEGYYFNSDLIGLDVVAEGKLLGVVRDVIEMPAQNLLEVLPPSNQVFHIPFVEPLVQDVDLASKTITVSLPEGLIDLNQASPVN